MQGKFARFIIAFAVAIAPSMAVAMSAPGHRASHCEVVAGEKLPAATGGAGAVCAAVEAAIAAHAPNVRYEARVRVVTPSMLATTLVVNGRRLPEQKFAVMDRQMGQASIKRFANSIAAEVARAAKL